MLRSLFLSFNKAQFSRITKISCCRCVKCGCELTCGLELIKCGKCGSFQPAPPTRAEPTCCPDYYRLLVPDQPRTLPTFNLDLKRLKGEYLRLQAAVHPDKLNNDGVGQSWSSWINRAHETLKDPLQRAIYLVTLYEKQQNKAQDEYSDSETTETADEGHDISLVLEVREEMDSTSDPTVLSEMKRSNDERIADCCRELETIFFRGDLRAARRCINRFRYWMSIDRELKER